MHTIIENEMMYGSWDVECDRIFVILGYFLLFYLTNNLKNKNFEKTKKHPGTSIFYTSVLYGVWFLRYEAWQTEVFVILG